jgi:hypothetical protein
MSIKEIYQTNKQKLVDLFGKSIFHDLISISFGFVSLLIALTLFLVFFFRLKTGDFLFPLVYNSTYGVTALGKWYMVYMYPLSFLLLTLVNILIAWAYFEKERLISYLVLFVNIVIGIWLVIIEFNLTALMRS